MRSRSTAFVLCLLAGAVATGCADAESTTDMRSAGQLLDEANRTMKALSSVTIVEETTTGLGNRYSTRLTTDLGSMCSFKAVTSFGSEWEQIRIGETDYIHANEDYFAGWGRKTVPAMRKKPWLKSPVSAADPADDLADCAWPYSSLGKATLSRATKGTPTWHGGKPVIPVEVRDDDLGTGTFTFYVAAEEEPYLVKVVHRDSYRVRLAEFRGLNLPVDIRPPAPADVLDLSSLPEGESGKSESPKGES